MAACGGGFTGHTFHLEGKLFLIPFPIQIKITLGRVIGGGSGENFADFLSSSTSSTSFWFSRYTCPNIAFLTLDSSQTSFPFTFFLYLGISKQRLSLSHSDIHQVSHRYKLNYCLELFFKLFLIYGTL